MKRLFFIFSLLFLSSAMIAQQFEAPKLKGSNFTKVKVKIGADFAMQYQAISCTADSALVPLGKGVNLPEANLNIGAILAPGIQVHLTVYLSSKHHLDTWVKGGYLLVDELPFIKGMNKIMKNITIKVGTMEINYGDAHFLRSDNGNIIRNPFIGNYIMDAFTTAPAAELMFRKNGFILMGGVSTGSLKPSLVNYGYGTYTPQSSLKQLAFYGKVGFDKQINPDFRVRVTLSGYHCKKNSFGTLYDGNRSGSRFNLVMVPQTNSSSDVNPSSNPFTGRWGPGFTNKDNDLMLFTLIDYKGLEFIGTYEKAKGTTAFGGANFDFTQYVGALTYRFGNVKQYYVGSRYNKVFNDNNQKVSRVEAGLGWFLTKNILVKAVYVNQKYSNFSQYGNNAGFKGVTLEAGVSF